MEPVRDRATHAPVCPHPSRSALCVPTEPTRSYRSCAHHDPHDSTIFHYCSVILRYQLSFCYNELNHFTRVNSAILLDILEILAQSFCVNLEIFAIVLSHSMMLQCSTIPGATVLSHPWCYNAQSSLVATVLSHFQRLQCSSILHCYSAQPFLMQKELRHSLLL
jgi:hypothetical protein